MHTYTGRRDKGSIKDAAGDRLYYKTRRAARRHLSSTTYLSPGRLTWRRSNEGKKKPKRYRTTASTSPRFWQRVTKFTQLPIRFLLTLAHYSFYREMRQMTKNKKKKVATHAHNFERVMAGYAKINTHTHTHTNTTSDSIWRVARASVCVCIFNTRGAFVRMCVRYHVRACAARVLFFHRFFFVFVLRSPHRPYRYRSDPATVRINVPCSRSHTHTHTHRRAHIHPSRHYVSSPPPQPRRHCRHHRLAFSLATPAPAAAATIQAIRPLPGWP